MSQPISPTHYYLLKQYGPLLTLEHLAQVMHSTPGGLRMAIARQRQPLAVALAGSRRRAGRRVYYAARQVARIIDEVDIDPEAGGQKVRADDDRS